MKDAHHKRISYFYGDRSADQPGRTRPTLRREADREILETAVHHADMANQAEQDRQDDWVKNELDEWSQSNL